jgi:hypothetical protein
MKTRNPSAIREAGERAERPTDRNRKLTGCRRISHYREGSMNGYRDGLLIVRRDRWTTLLELGTALWWNRPSSSAGLREPAAGAELHRDDRDVQGVDQVRVEERPDGLVAAAEAHVMAVLGCRCE